jgi:tripartite-type tricarboxylate transporter receptor subunit TctC
MIRDWRKSLFGFAILGAAVVNPAAAQDYPNRTIRVIVPFGAGGPTDMFTRVLGEELRKALGSR